MQLEVENYTHPHHNEWPNTCIFSGLDQSMLKYSRHSRIHGEFLCTTSDRDKKFRRLDLPLVQHHVDDFFNISIAFNTNILNSKHNSLQLQQTIGIVLVKLVCKCFDNTAWFQLSPALAIRTSLPYYFSTYFNAYVLAPHFLPFVS